MPRKTIKISTSRAGHERAITLGAVPADDFKGEMVAVYLYPEATYLGFNGRAQFIFIPGDKLIIEFGEIPDAKA